MFIAYGQVPLGNLWKLTVSWSYSDFTNQLKWAWNRFSVESPGIRGSSGERPWPDVKIERPVAVRLLLGVVVKGCQTELDKQELSRALLNFSVALCRSVEARDGLVLAAVAGAFTVDGHEDGVIDGGLDQRKLVRKVLARDLHFLGAGLLRPPEERFDPRREVSLLSTSTFGVETRDVVSELKARPEKSANHMTTPANVVPSPRVHTGTKRQPLSTSGICRHWVRLNSRVVQTSKYSSFTISTIF